jgi:hypothetical protein
MRFVPTALTVGAYAIAMAYVESAVVVDLNGALGQRVGELFPLRDAMTVGPLIAIEVGREAATLVMLAAVGILAGRSSLERLAWTGVAFGTWDIAYYGWLHVFTGWPPSLGTWDVLFLIPLPWTAPVWAPIAVSLALIGFGLAGARRLRGGGTIGFTRRHLAVAVAGGLLVILSFTLDAPALLGGAVPASYAWPLFALGLGLGVVAAVDALRRRAERRRIEAA